MKKLFYFLILLTNYTGMQATATKILTQSKSLMVSIPHLTKQYSIEITTTYKGKEIPIYGAGSFANNSLRYIDNYTSNFSGSKNHISINITSSLNQPSYKRSCTRSPRLECWRSSTGFIGSAEVVTITLTPTKIIYVDGKRAQSFYGETKQFSFAYSDLQKTNSLVIKNNLKTARLNKSTVLKASTPRY